jgi:uncharacterized iron-regulated membrane protein
LSAATSALRRALFQVHLWLGVALGLYVLAICLTGSAIVFRREMDRSFCPRIVMVTPSGPRLTDVQLETRAQAAYQGVEPRRIEIRGPRVPGAATEVWYVGGTVTQERLFDPYTGKDLGDTVACEPELVTSLADFHDRLLGGHTGLLVNGLGAIVVTLMCATGAVIWWPGRGRWWRRMSLQRGVGWRRFIWDLHNMLGFWLFFLIALWALSGIYFAFPMLFEPLGDDAIAWFVRVHFGRSFGFPVKVAWAIFGLVPCVLFITGVLMWWNRVVRPQKLARRTTPT